MQMSRFLFFKSCTIRTIGFTIRTNRTIHYKSKHITNHLAEKTLFRVLSESIYKEVCLLDNPISRNIL